MPDTWTLGSLLFFGGIAGVAATLATALIAAVALKVSKNRIKRMLNTDHGMGKR